MTVTVMLPIAVVAMMWACVVQATPSGISLPPASPDTDMGVTCTPLSRDVTVCRLQGIIRGHEDVNVTVTVNGCHQPVDVTFRMMSSQNLSWNFTFVPNNQNERVYIPGVYLVPPVPVAPTYLYVREPEEEYRSRNYSTGGALITVEASLVAVLSNNMWEEEEFLNHTFQLPPHCPRRGRGTPVHSPLNTWLTRGLVLAASLTVLLALAAAVTMKRRQFLALWASWREQGGDDLSLVHHLEQQQHTQPSSETVISSEMSTQKSSAPGADENSKTVITENNNIMNVGDGLQTEGNGNPSSKNVRDLSPPQDGSTRDGGVSIIMESYSLGNDGRNPSERSDVEKSNNSGEQRNFLGRMKKIKERFQVGLKGITFETLKEDQQNLPETENPENLEKESSVVIANPLFKSKIDDISKHSEETRNDMLPLDDDLSNDAYFYTQVKKGNRSDSYSNIFHPNVGESTCDVTTSPHGTTSGKLESVSIVTSKVNNNNNTDVPVSAPVVGRGGGIISHAAKNGFGYGSREWLNELEGATAVLPSNKHATGKKKKRAMKSNKLDSSKAANGEGGRRGHEERKNKARKITSSTETGMESGTAYTKSNIPKGEHSGAERRSTGGSSRPVHGTDDGLDARKIVKEVLDNGFFDYNNEHDQSHPNGDTSLTNGHTPAKEAAGVEAGACHPLALKGLQSGGVRPKTSWTQANVAS